jgi:hypothetical protein
LDVVNRRIVRNHHDCPFIAGPFFEITQMHHRLKDTFCERRPVGIWHFWATHNRVSTGSRVGYRKCEVIQEALCIVQRSETSKVFDWSLQSKTSSLAHLCFVRASACHALSLDAPLSRQPATDVAPRANAGTLLPTCQWHVERPLMSQYARSM